MDRFYGFPAHEGIIIQCMRISNHQGYAVLSFVWSVLLSKD